MATYNDALIETLSAQPSLTFCANKQVLEEINGLFDRYATQHIYLKNPEDALTAPPTDQDRALITLVNVALHQCRIPEYFTPQSDFYLYRNNTFTRLDDSSQIEIRALINNLLEPDAYLNDLNRFWNADHSATQQPRRTFVAQAIALLTQCEASLRFETGSLEPASVALVRQLSTTALPETLNISHLCLQDITRTDEIALVGAFALSIWPPGDQRTANPTVLYLPGQRLTEFANPMALKKQLASLFKSTRGRQQLLPSVAHRQHAAFESLAQRASQDGRVNLIPVAAVEDFFNHQVSLLITKQRQDVEHHWAVSRNVPDGVIEVINQATNLAPLLNFSEAVERYARELLTLSAQRSEATRAAQQRLTQLQIYRTIDFTGLLVQLKSLQAESARQPLAQQFFIPQRHSPLYNACARAVGVLQKLKNDTDFSAWLANRSKKTEFDWSPLLVVETLINNQPAIVDSPLTRFTIQGVLLPLSEVPTYWRNDIDVLIEARRDIGDGIREDGTVRLDLALKFYSVQTTANSPLQLLIERLQERAATLSLGMGEGRVPFDEIIDEQGDAILKQRLNQRQLTGSDSIFNQMTEDFLTPQRETQALKTPTVVLEQWLNTPQCLELGKQLVEALDWYTAEDETPPAKVLRGLVWRAFWLHFHGPTDNDRVSVAGEEIATSRHWGCSYSAIRRQIEQSLSRNHPLTPGGVQLAMRLVQEASAAEIWVKDIPDDLHFASSIAWVNFKAGVILAQAIAPDAAQHTTFQQLLGLLATASQDATPEQELVISLARVGPTVEWAKANGVLTTENTELSPEQAQLAVEALEQHEQEIIQATETIAHSPPGRWRFTTDDAFEQGFSNYLSGVKTAYQTLIRALLPNLPLPDRRAIENGEVTLYALRQELRDLQVQQETAQNIAAARGRHGFIIQALFQHRTTYYEVFPRAALIRARPDIQTLTINGNVVVRKTGGSTRSSRGSFRLATSMPFDWDAYQHGQRPRDDVSSQVIAEQIGHVLPATAAAPSGSIRAPQSWSSARSRRLAAIVANDLFHTDESQLKLSAQRNVSVLDAPQQAIDDFIYYAKMLVPFWGGVEDITSGDPQRVERGALSLFTDLVSFAVPIGKYVGGSARLVAQGGRISFQAALPKFATLTKTFLLGTLAELNPLAVVPALLKLAGLGLLRLSSAAVRQINAGLALFKKALSKPAIVPTGRTLQSVDPRVWKPLEAQDSLFNVGGVDHVPLRSVGTDLLPEYRLIDPLSNTIFGPRYIPMGAEGLQRIPDLDDYIAPVSYEQAAEFSRRANGVYDGKNQQSYVRARGQWYAIETRYSLTGDTEFYIVHPYNKTRPAHRVINKDGGWLPVDERGHAGGKRLEELKKAKAERDAYHKNAHDKMHTATHLLDETAQSTAFNMKNLIIDRSHLHWEATRELGLIHTKNTALPVFESKNFASTPDLGRARLIETIEVADTLSPRYAAVIDHLEGYLEAQQKNIQRLKETGIISQQDAASKQLTDFFDSKNKAVGTVIEQAKVFKSLLDEDLDHMLDVLEKLPVNKAGPSRVPSALPGTSKPAPSATPTPLKPTPENRIPILIAGEHPRASVTVLAKPRAGNSNVADVLNNDGQRIGTYIRVGEDKLWIQSNIQIKEPSQLASLSQATVTQELNGAARTLQNMIEEFDDLIVFYRNKAAAEPAGAEALIRSGATKLNQGADDLQAACTAITDEATRQSLLAQLPHFRENAARYNAMAKAVRADLISKQAPNGQALAFLHSQPGGLSIRKTQNRVAGIRQVQKPGGRGWTNVPDFLDEFEIHIRGKPWAYAHMRFEQATSTVPTSCNLKTPAQRALAANAQTNVAREGRRLDFYRAEIDWPQARRVFYPALAE
ncbi:hypothetical protein [Pseudomonas reactans]|uniref:hypothetical protein n=1 Tax=Pseudomonas reactans TaxID=117680 RepID=UPI0015A199D8|nr:hypothetical protein [Pseudomonas reactans]NWA69702.1 hypothetical protein [Pseudomonas reactans]